MTVSTRFAPSPTGHLHIGNTRTALITWLFARRHNGHYLLRLDDTDQDRSKQEYVESIKQDLTWLGLNWDESVHQKDRMDRYDEVIEQLKDDGYLYACYETPEELSLKRKSRLTRGLPPIYDREALTLTDEQIAKYRDDGRRPHWRFKLTHEPIQWQDRVRGEVEFQGADLSDPVVIREDGTPLYHLCSVIDDIDFNITHVIRGEDHVSNTATHVQMFQAIGAKVPEFAHLPLLTGAEGGKLSKRLGSLGVRDLREDERLEPMAINSLLARLGTSEPIEAFQELQPLIDSFSFDHFSRGAPKFDVEELERLNAKILHDKEFDQVADRLREMGLEEVTQDFWNAVRPNLTRLDDIQDWWQITQQEITPAQDPSDLDFTRQAADLLPEGELDEKSFSTWIAHVKQETGRSGKSLYMPIRKALTGQAHGPELSDLLPLIGRDRAITRLTGDNLQNAA
jgi:glutamyl-tRNA synthetase